MVDLRFPLAHNKTKVRSVQWRDLVNHKNEDKNPPAAAGNQSRSNQASFPASDLQDEGNAEQPVPRPTPYVVRL